MVHLTRTENSLAELAASRYQDVGMRPSERMAIADQGFIVGEEPFEVAAHDLSDINLFSLNAAITGVPHVTERLPEKSIDVNVVLHEDPQEATDPDEIYWGRKIVAVKTLQAVRNSLLFNDRAHFYLAGDSDSPLPDRETILLPDLDTPAKSAEAVAEICAMRGLAVVISTFNNLPLESAGTFDMTVGIKVNHAFDLCLPSNVGEWATGEEDMPVVQTNDGLFGKTSKELIRYQQRQAERHNQIVHRLQEAGIKMAQVIFDRGNPQGFDIEKTDSSISKAIKDVANEY